MPPLSWEYYSCDLSCQTQIESYLLHFAYLQQVTFQFLINFKIFKTAEYFFKAL